MMRPRAWLGGAIAPVLLALYALAGLPGPQVLAADASVLDRYLQGLQSLRTGFRQTVSDANGSTVEAGAGELIVQRPGKFRWVYAPNASTSTDPHSSGQLLVADGRNLWFYDRELAQVTVKPVASVLSPTPVMLLSGSVADLHAQFEVSAGKPHDGLDWVLIQPHSAEADFSRAELGFAGEQLARMVINDRLGQTVRLDFEHSQRNAQIDAANFSFVPPAGVDVIGTPQP
jgi:outer membrane lipoprotein carrier protein